MIPRRKQKIEYKNLFYFLFQLLKGFRKESTLSNFQQMLEQETNLDNLLFTSSGRGAILLGIRSMGIHPGDEILVSALNLGELIPLLTSEGYSVKLVDINPEDLSMSSKKVINAITPKTKLIMITHLFSIVSNNDELIKIANENNIKILEDSAHTLNHIGKKYKRSYSDCIIFSFEVNKPLCTYGGGALYLKNHDHLAIAQNKLKEIPYNSLSLFKKLLFSHIEELIIFSPFFKLIITILSHRLIQGLFEKAYRTTNTSFRSSSSYHPFQAYLGIQDLERLKIRNHLLLELVSLFTKIQNPDITFFPNYQSSDYFYSLVFTTKDPGHFKQTAAKHSIDVGIKTEVIDNCAKYFEQNEMSMAASIEQSIVLYPLYHNLKLQQILKLKHFLENYRHDN